MVCWHRRWRPSANLQGKQTPNVTTVVILNTSLNLIHLYVNFEFIQLWTVLFYLLEFKLREPSLETTTKASYHLIVWKCYKNEMLTPYQRNYISAYFRKTSVFLCHVHIQLFFQEQMSPRQRVKLLNQAFWSNYSVFCVELYGMFGRHVFDW